MRRNRKLRVALAQVDCELGNLEKNAEKAKRIARDYRNDVDLIVFPELSLTGYGVGQNFPKYALNQEDEIFLDLVHCTQNLTLAFGLIEETASFTFYNSLAFTGNRRLIHLHRKIFLPNYGKFEERKYFSPGPTYRCFDLDNFRIAPLICGDAWDPALANLGAADRATVFVISVNSPEEGLGSRLSTKENWKRVIRFYASMYGVYVLFVNRVGTEGSLTFWGESELIDPYGEVVTRSDSKEEEVVVGEIDLSEVREARTVLNTIRDQDLGFIERRLKEIIRRRASD